MNPSSLPLATLGTLIPWFGWFGFNGASQLALDSDNEVVAISQIFANTNMAAADGVITAYLLSLILGRGTANLSYCLNGALAGLVATTAEPLTPIIGEAIMIVSVGALAAMLGARLLVHLRIDDGVGAISVNLFAGIWGMLAVPLTNSDATFYGQSVGIIAIGTFVFSASFITWFALTRPIGSRLSETEESLGGYLSELGHDAGAIFTPSTQFARKAS